MIIYFDKVVIILSIYINYAMHQPQVSPWNTLVPEQKFSAQPEE